MGINFVPLWKIRKLKASNYKFLTQELTNSLVGRVTPRNQIFFTQSSLPFTLYHIYLMSATLFIFNVSIPQLSTFLFFVPPNTFFQ